MTYHLVEKMAHDYSLKDIVFEASAKDNRAHVNPFHNIDV